MSAICPQPSPPACPMSVQDIKTSTSASTSPQNSPRRETPNSDRDLNVEEEDIEENSNQSSIGSPENLSMKEQKCSSYDDPQSKHDIHSLADKWNSDIPQKYQTTDIQQYSGYKINPRNGRDHSVSRKTSASSNESTTKDTERTTPTVSRSEPIDSRTNSPSYPVGNSRSPVDVLLRVFPGRRRSDIECILSKFKGDVIQAMEAMLSENAAANTSNFIMNHSAYHLNQDSPPYSIASYQSKSAFSPLSSQSMKFSPSRRFLTPPYSGTGYLPTVIRPPPDYLSSFLTPSAAEIYGRATMQVSSPTTSPHSDHTNNEGFSD